MVSENRFASASTYENQPISKTYQYKKVMKPMLERKRRARINRCLDELKEIMVAVFQAEGENVSKVEKADILEMTVSHLHKLRKQRELISKSDSTYADRFRAGFSQCATEVISYLTTVSSAAVDNHSTTKLLEHLGSCVKTLEFSYGQPIEKKGQTIQRFQFAASGSTKFLKKIRKSIQIIQSRNSEKVSLWRPW